MPANRSTDKPDWSQFIGKHVGHAKVVRLGDRSWIEKRTVKLMAVKDNYAMVRYPGCMPYVAPLKEIVFPDEKRRVSEKRPHSQK